MTSESLKQKEQKMLFEIMETREALEEAEEEHAIREILESSALEINECLRQMEISFERRDLFEARHQTIRLNYLSKIQAEAEAKLERLSAL